jgi:putative transposase
MTMLARRDRHHRRSTRLKGYDYASAGAYFVTVCVHGREPVLGEVVNDEVVLSEWGRVIDHFWTRLPVHFPNVTVDTHVTMPNHIHAIIVIDPDTGRRGAEKGGAQESGETHVPAYSAGAPPLQNRRGDVIAAHGGERPRNGCGDLIAPPPQNEHGRGAVAAPHAVPASRGETPEEGGETPEEGGETPPLQNEHGRGAVAAPNGEPTLLARTTLARPTLGQIVAFYKFQTTKIINEMRDAPGARFWQRNFYDTIIRNQRQLDALREYIHQNPARWALDTENPTGRVWSIADGSLPHLHRRGGQP